MNSDDSASRLLAARILPQRAGGTLPLRRSSPLIEACDAMKRCASSDSDISSENSATAFSLLSAAYSAKLAISADLPIPGLAARMIRLPAWKPPVMRSRSSKPDGVPVTDRPSAESCSSLSSSAGEQVVDRAEVLAAVLVGDLEDRALGEVDELARRRLVGVHARLDLVRRVQQPPQHRVLAHDPRVLADVADGGHRAGEQVDGGAAADALEQAALLEVLDERERVDRLAHRVEVEHRLEDQAVGLAVEVLGLEALVDDQRRQRGVRQQHGAEHGLLGFEVLGRRGCGASVAVGDGHRGGRV